jgi:hypothetical protein
LAIRFESFVKLEDTPQGMVIKGQSEKIIFPLWLTPASALVRGVAWNNHAALVRGQVIPAPPARRPVTPGFY